jgi:hypothetical protein
MSIINKYIEDRVNVQVTLPKPNNKIYAALGIPSSQPVSLSINLYSEAEFTFIVGGATRYIWYKNSEALSPTSSKLVFEVNEAAINVPIYSVAIGSGWAVASDMVYLNVNIGWYNRDCIITCDSVITNCKDIIRCI